LLPKGLHHNVGQVLGLHAYRRHLALAATPGTAMNLEEATDPEPADQLGAVLGFRQAVGDTFHYTGHFSFLGAKKWCFAADPSPDPSRPLDYFACVTLLVLH
jgi:hypothetical protein